MSAPRISCLILACGNPLRGDDGIGPWLAAWAEDRFPRQPGLQIISRQQWTPELSQDIARADAVLFLDASVENAPGALQFAPVEPSEEKTPFATHHLSAAQLLSLCRELYSSQPRHALLLTVGVGSTELGREFSPTLKESIPQACALLESRILELLRAGQRV